VVGGEAHERTGFLGGPAGGERQTLRRRKPKRVMDFHLKNLSGGTDARREKNPEVGETNEALFREGRLIQRKVAS
jgi:hypothetical protein